MALILFRDSKWQGDRAILATMEVDLTRGSQLVYVIPDIMLTIGDFYCNIQISIQTRGYEQWQNNEANLLITRGMVGRLFNTSNVGFSYEIHGVVDYLTSHGVCALPGRRYSTTDLQGLNWVIQPTQMSIPLQPREVNSRNLIDRRVSVSFDNYAIATMRNQPTYNSRDETVPSDEEEVHSLAVFISSEAMFIRRLTPTATMSKRRSLGAAGLDLAASEHVDIPQCLGMNNSLVYLIFTNSGLVGSIPPGICFRNQLGFSRWGYNKLNGTIPPGLGNCLSLKRLILTTISVARFQNFL